MADRECRELLDRTVDLAWLAEIASGENINVPFLRGFPSGRHTDDALDRSDERYAFCSEILRYLLWIDDVENVSINRAMFIACHPKNPNGHWLVVRDTCWQWLNSLRPAMPFFYVRVGNDYSDFLPNPFGRQFVERLDQLASSDDAVIEFLSTAKLVADRLEKRLQRNMPRRPQTANRARAGRQPVRSFFGFPRFPSKLETPGDLSLIEEPVDNWVNIALNSYNADDWKYDVWP
jgi:hypothetical protein